MIKINFKNALLRSGIIATNDRDWKPSVARIDDPEDFRDTLKLDFTPPKLESDEEALEKLKEFAAEEVKTMLVDVCFTVRIAVPNGATESDISLATDLEVAERIKSDDFPEAYSLDANDDDECPFDPEDENDLNKLLRYLN